MAKPRIFISSTYYDLKHIRASLDIFIESLGFESVLSEKGNIAYAPDIPLDESCYREVGSTDVFVLIIGGRYGSAASDQDKNKLSRAFFDRYDSITKKEYDSAIEKDIPTYILIESNVQSEYQTYLRNKGNQKIEYAHVDSANIFNLIEYVFTRPRNNPVHSFEKATEIESWLRDQWAGLFKELLQRMSSQSQLTTLTGQIAELKEINNTLRKYLEAVMTGQSRADSTKLIKSEAERLRIIEQREQVERTAWFDYVRKKVNIDVDDFIDIIKKTKSYDEFAKLIGQKGDSLEIRDKIADILNSHEDSAV